MPVKTKIDYISVKCSKQVVCLYFLRDLTHKHMTTYCKFKGAAASTEGPDTCKCSN